MSRIIRHLNGPRLGNPIEYFYYMGNRPIEGIISIDGSLLKWLALALSDNSCEVYSTSPVHWGILALTQSFVFHLIKKLTLFLCECKLTSKFSKVLWEQKNESSIKNSLVGQMQDFLFHR